MKQVKKIDATLKYYVAVVLLCLVNTVTWAQDKKVDVDIDVNKGDDWYTRPWVWIVGGAVFLLLLVALLRGGGRKD